MLAVVVLVGALAGAAHATHSSSDVDGDGWANTNDNCPSVYNDRNRQGGPQFDQDGDGVGDACDASWWPNDGGTAWELAFYFVDSAMEPIAASTCGTVTVTETVHYGPPYNFDATNTDGPTHTCMTDGAAWYDSHWRGSAVASLSRTYEIDCDSGGVLTGSIPDGLAYYLPVSNAGCTQSLMYLWGIGNTKQLYGPPWGSLAQNPTAQQSEPVNTAIGNYYTSATDLRLHGIGVPFSFTRSYNSADSTSGLLGPGWTDNLEASLTIQQNGDAVARGPDGQQLHFTHEPDGSFLADLGGRATLTTSGGTYELVTHDQTHYLFDAQGRLTAVRDRNGKGLSLAYDGSGQLQSATDAAGRVVSFTVTGGRITSVALPDGRNVQFGYTNGFLTSVTDARGGTTQYTYDGGGRLATIVDQNNHTLVTNYYDQTTGRVNEQVDARGDHSYFAWDPSTGTSTFTDARGKQWKDVYSQNVLVKQIDPLNDTTLYDYDGQMNLEHITDPNGNTTSMSYDGNGNMLTRTPPTPFTFHESWTYDSFNDVKTYTDGRGNTTTYDYDTSGNLTKITEPDPDGAGPLTAPVTTITRDPAGTGLITAIQDPRLKTTTYGYDAAGNLTSIQTPLGNKTTMHYDGSGRMDWLVEPRGNVQGANPDQYKWQFTYNNFDEVLTRTDPLSHGITNIYDPTGRLTSSSDANQHATSYTYWPSNQVKTVTAPDPDGAGPLAAPVTSYAYDPAGNLSSRTDANLHVTQYSYDDAGRLASVQTPLNKLWTYTYDANGNLKTVVDANGNATPTAGDGTTTYGYDQLNRLTSSGYSDSTPAASFGYDPNGNRTSMTDGSGTVSYVWDTLNRLTSVTRGTDTFSTAYDSDGNATKSTYPDTTAITYAYDDDDRMTSAVNTSVGTTSYGYDPAGNLTSTTLPSGNGYVETRVYDNAGRLTEIKNAKGASTLSRYVATLDPIGEPTQIARTGAVTSTTTYGYDNIGRLTSVCFQASCPNQADPKIAWTYDGVGNRLTENRSGTTTNYAYDADGRMTSAGSTTYAYDSDGNQTQAGSRTFAWDLAGRMKSTTSGSTTMTYSYDGDGLRLKASTGSGANANTNYSWDITHPLPQLALERNGSNSLIRRYVYGLGLISMNSGGSNYFYHYGPLGSVSELTSSAGATQWTYAYEPFGVTRTETKNNTKAPTNVIKFNGQLLDTTPNLYYLRAREYDPATGRFSSRDPYQQPIIAPYVADYPYALDQPTILMDPSGLCSPLDCLKHVVHAVTHIHGTVGGCVGGTLGAFFVTVQGNVCVVVSSNGGVGVTATGGGNLTSASTPDISGNVTGQVSNARCVGDLGGPFFHAGGSADVGGGVTGDVFTSPNGRVVGATGGVGAGIGGEVHAGGTDTVTATLGPGCMAAHQK